MAASVLLLPLDEASESHIERLIQQRVTCGWNADQVPTWIKSQKEKKKVFFWVVSAHHLKHFWPINSNYSQVLHPENPSSEQQLLIHLSQNPREATPLSNTSAHPDIYPHDPQLKPSMAFHPIGHISLNFDDEPALVDPQKGIYCISTFYISRSLQGSGIGKAALSAFDDLAVKSPISASTLTLRTMSDYNGVKTKLHARLGVPNDVPTEDWYKKRGYEVFRITDEEGFLSDAGGKGWDVRWIYMRKTLEV